MVATYICISSPVPRCNPHIHAIHDRHLHRHCPPPRHHLRDRRLRLPPAACPRYPFPFLPLPQGLHEPHLTQRQRRHSFPCHRRPLVHPRLWKPLHRDSGCAACGHHAAQRPPL
ncbi:hypothetical protein L226DRAFT_252549 [Lentinus tigrinus ALCF2SS1-7]|nr:hypothetical protein L226DRAFT_252549 [Lentinus tigrinus ALCF2SS1-7]